MQTLEEIDFDDWPDDDDDDDALLADEDWPGGVCGRWRNGRLVHDCLLAGTEDCDWECPYRDRSFLKEKPDADA